MTKIEQLPERVKEGILKKLPVKTIIERLTKCDFYKSDDCFTIQFTSDHPLFEFDYINDIIHAPDEIVEVHKLKLTYLDCLELLWLHYRRKWEVYNEEEN